MVDGDASAREGSGEVEVVGVGGGGIFGVVDDVLGGGARDDLTAATERPRFEAVLGSPCVCSRR